MPTSPSRRSVYCSIAAQWDNLGDIAIRQTAIDWLADAGIPLVVFTGSMPPDYVQAFSLPESARLVSSQKSFALSLLGASFTRRAHLLFAPGPFQIRPGRAAVVKSLINLGNVLAVRASGGRAFALGRAIRGRAQPSFAIERFALGRFDYFVVRDNVSSAAIGRTLLSAPDMAFGQSLEAIAPRERRYFAISLRGDRVANVPLLQKVIDEARSASLEPIFVTQVRRDDPQHRDLATRFGAEICEWGDRSHSEQLERVSNIYAASHSVLSDRLHALIFAVRRSALPIGLLHPNSDKLTSTLEDVIPIRFLDSSASTPSAPLDLDEDGSARSALESAVQGAQAELDSVRSSVLRLVS